jgi:hypothetical protein
MLSEQKIREIAQRHFIPLRDVDQASARMLLIENVIREALIENDRPKPVPNAGCL